MAVLLLAACQPVELDGGSSGPDEIATVTWIYDGDTIEVDLSGSFTDVRLMGINAPDVGECFFDEALAYLIRSLEGRQVDLEVIGDDQYGRTLAYVWVDGAPVNLDLVERGFAIATTPDGDDRDGAAILEAEEEARSRQRGMWGEMVCGANGLIPDLNLQVDPFQEFVTIENLDPAPVELERWVLRDESSRHRYTFADGTTLSPGETVRITSSDDGWDPGEPRVWNNDGDMAMVLDEHGRVIAVSRYP